MRPSLPVSGALSRTTVGDEVAAPRQQLVAQDVVVLGQRPWSTRSPSAFSTSWPLRSRRGGRTAAAPCRPGSAGRSDRPGRPRRSMRRRDRLSAAARRATAAVRRGRRRGGRRRRGGERVGRRGAGVVAALHPRAARTRRPAIRAIARPGDGRRRRRDGRRCASTTAPELPCATCAASLRALRPCEVVRARCRCRGGRHQRRLAAARGLRLPRGCVTGFLEGVGGLDSARRASWRARWRTTASIAPGICTLKRDGGSGSSSSTLRMVIVALPVNGRSPVRNW